MRIGYASDLHLEFSPISLKNTDEIDVLVLAGDICVAEDIKRFPFCEVREETESHRQEKSARYAQFFSEVSKEFPNIVMVAGNHEHYHGKYNQTINILKQNISVMFPNIHVLSDESVEIGDAIFVGATLWTDLNHGCPMTQYHLADVMYDYRGITFDSMVGCDALYRKLRPSDTFASHQRSKDYIKAVLSNSKDRDVFVVSHHAPSLLSIDSKYSDHHLTNGGYVSDLQDIILDNKNLKVWFHGHVHSEFNYVIGNTNIRCNPRGYPDELVHGYFRVEYIDV